ncbi:MAG: hypothetical protein CL608_14340 [Anaerolineaceae bacterium]|nr:hypothetical protein [Anaerolineaceae bacterium]
MKRLLLNLGLSWQIILGILLLGGLFLPTRTIAAIPGTMTHVGAMSFVQWVLPAAALIMVSLLLGTGLPRYLAWRNGREAGPATAEKWLGAAFLLVGGLLLVKLPHSLYWLFVWDSTHDSFDILWLVIFVPLALFAGFMLAVRLPKQKHFWVLGLPLLPILTCLVVLQVDYHELTVARADRVAVAVETFQDRNGRYPETLNQLTPWYLLSIPEPTIIYGQDWCYAGGDSTYRLAYVDLEHWSSPDAHGKIHQSAGDLSHLPPLCQDQFAVLQVQHSGYFHARID